MGFAKTKRYLFQARYRHFSSLLFSFLRASKIRGTVCFMAGVLLILFGWTFVGLIVEFFGFINLFGYAPSFEFDGDSRDSNFFPIAIGFLQRMPIIGPFLDLPGISKVSLSSCESLLMR